MSDPPGVPSALGIEAVEWFAHGEESVTVRVTGRWRRRRPAPSGQPLLVIESEGQRHRFPAMPEPPGLTGAAPGTWQLSFSVPAALAPPAGERAWLQMGAVVVPLPVTVGLAPSEAPAPAPAPAAAPSDPQLLAERRLRSSELALQAARERATRSEQASAELAARVEQLEHELALARREPERLRARLHEREAALRAAEQRAYAEEALREDLQAQLERAPREGDDADAVREQLEANREREQELETELEQVRREVDEAEHEAAAARAARSRAERALAELAARPASPVDPRVTELSEAISAELALAERARELAAAADRPAREFAARRARTSAALRIERTLVLARSPRRILAGPDRLEPERGGRRLNAAFEALRAELAELRTLVGRERELRTAAQARAAELERRLAHNAERATGAYEAIEELRAEVSELRRGARGLPPLAGAAPPSPPRERWPTAGEPGAGELDPERLDAALTRLRENAAAQADPAEADAPDRLPRPPVRPWLGPVLRALAERDPGAAGRLLLALLPAQGLVVEQALAYDLVLTELGCVQVDVASAGQPARVRLTDSARDRSEVSFAITGKLTGLARAVATGSLRRRFGRRAVRISGDREAASAIPALVSRPLGMPELLQSGVGVDAWLGLTVVSLMIEPAWTRGERFTIAFREPGAAGLGQLQIRDGRPPAVGESTLLGPAETSVTCQADAVLAALAGVATPPIAVEGEPRHLRLVRSWLERAQSG